MFQRKIRKRINYQNKINALKTWLDQNADQCYEFTTERMDGDWSDTWSCSVRSSNTPSPLPISIHTGKTSEEALYCAMEALHSHISHLHAGTDTLVVRAGKCYVA